MWVLGEHMTQGRIVYFLSKYGLFNAGSYHKHNIAEQERHKTEKAPKQNINNHMLTNNFFSQCRSPAIYSDGRTPRHSYCRCSNGLTCEACRCCTSHSTSAVY